MNLVKQYEIKPMSSFGHENTHHFHQLFSCLKSYSDAIIFQPNLNLALSNSKDIGEIRGYSATTE